MRFTMSATVYSVVANRSRETIDAYLYTNTTSVVEDAEYDGMHYVILQTTAQRDVRVEDPLTVEEMFREAKRCAEYQVERLQSGLMHAEVVGTRSEARERLAELVPA